MDWVKSTARRDEKHLSFGIWSLLYKRFDGNFKSIIFKLIILNTVLGTWCKIVLSCVPQNLTNQKLALVQIMAWCHQAASYYLSQCWPRSMWLYGVSRPQFCILCDLNHGDRIPLTCNGSATRTAPWSTGFVAPKTEMKHPLLHWSRDLALRILQHCLAVGDSDGLAMYSVLGPVSNMSQTLWFPTLEDKEDPERHGPNV